MLKALLLLSVLIAPNRFQEKRLLLIFTDKAANPLFVEQQNILKADAAGLIERDIEVKLYYAEHNKALFKQRQIKSGLTVILVGKDGGDKLSSTMPLSLKKLYSTIDAMPMRKDEMKQHP